MSSTYPVHNTAAEKRYLAGLKKGRRKGAITPQIDIADFVEGEWNAMTPHESTTQPGLFFWAEPNGGGESYCVVSQAVGYPATEAFDDWLCHWKDADEIAQKLAQGIDPNVPTAKSESVFQETGKWAGLDRMLRGERQPDPLNTRPNPWEFATHPAKQGGYRYQDDVDSDTAAGYDARCDGHPITDNPWHDKSEAYFKWNAGWSDADEALKSLRGESVSTFITNLLEFSGKEPPAPRQMDEFTRAYIEAALWSSTDNADDSGGEPLDKNYGMEDIDPATLHQMMDDCAKFQEENGDDIDNACLTRSQYSDREQAGHDFWLTREGHGAGFWETFDWEEEAGKRLTQASKEFGSFYLYVGDDDHTVYGDVPRPSVGQFGA